jgi:RNA polymerase sigma-70 factor (ECF subfamily)
MPRPPAPSQRRESEGSALSGAEKPAEPSDADLVRRAAAGDRDAFATIYERHRLVVYRFARLMSGSDTTAEDVTQEVFVTLIRTLPSYEPHRARLATYLYGVARNATRNHLRRDRRFVALDAAAGTPCARADDPHDAAASAQELGRLRRAILSLPSRYREAIVLSDVHGLAYTETAHILDVPVGTVRSRLNRGRHMIAERLRTTEDARPAAVPRIERCVV